MQYVYLQLFRLYIVCPTLTFSFSVPRAQTFNLAIAS